MSTRVAADRICGVPGDADDSVEDLRLQLVDWRNARKWYKHLLDLCELPCETKKSIMRPCTTIWNDERDKELKLIVDECPVLYLDEIAAKLRSRFGVKFVISAISRRLRRTS